MWKEILEKYGATIYRGVGGDEFVIVSGHAFDLDGALREFTQAFRDRYSILRVTRPLAREERPFFKENPYVIAAANYGTATHILVDRKKLNEDGKWDDFTREVQLLKNKSFKQLPQQITIRPKRCCINTKQGAGKPRIAQVQLGCFDEPA